MWVVFAYSVLKIMMHILEKMLRSPAVRKMQVRTTICHLLLIRMVISKNRM